MTIKRAAEILNSKHREVYDSIETVNEACLVGMNALNNSLWYNAKKVIPEDEHLVLCYTNFGFKIMSYDSNTEIWKDCTGYFSYIKIFVKYWKELPDKPDKEKGNIYD